MNQGEPVDLRMAERIRRVKEIVGLFESGQMSAVRAVSQIEDVAAGEDERIVHVGTQHKPEIQT